MSKLEISDLQLNAELVELSDEDAEQVQGGGWFNDALNGVVDWITEPNDGTTGGALETTVRAVIATPAVGSLALFTVLEYKVVGH